MTITHHIGIYGNSPLSTPVVCNRPFNAVAIISVLDFVPGVTAKKYKICKSCLDLLTTGTTRGLKKANKVNSLLYQIRHNIRTAQRYHDWGWIHRTQSYCDTAHKYEEELINLYR